MHVVCTVDLNTVGVDTSVAQQTACTVAQWVWEHRDRFRQLNMSPTDAVAKASQLAPGSNTGDVSIEGPVVLHEISDNPGSGAPVRQLS